MSSHDPQQTARDPNAAPAVSLKELLTQATSFMGLGRSVPLTPQHTETLALCSHGSSPDQLVRDVCECACVHMCVCVCVCVF